jgi:hypothetical protein
MYTGETYQGNGQMGGRERNREQLIRGEREVALVEIGNGMGLNGH